MPAMVTALTEFSDNGNSRTYTTAGHLATKPKLVIQKRKVPSGNQKVAESTFDVIHATTDADGAVLTQKVLGSVSIRTPVDGQSTDTDAVVVILRDIVQSDEFAAAVSTQNWLA